MQLLKLLSFSATDEFIKRGMEDQWLKTLEEASELSLITESVAGDILKESQVEEGS